jgi:hypothetical protein
VTRLGDSINENDGDVLFLAKRFLSPVFMIFLYWVLVKMKQALRMIYGDGIFDLSARLTGRLIAGLPLVGFLSLSMISAIMVEKQSFDTMCRHLGAKREATAGVRNSIQKKHWENCTNNELYKRFEHKFPPFFTENRRFDPPPVIFGTVPFEPGMPVTFSAPVTTTGL